MISQPRRRRASAALGPVRSWRSRRAVLAAALAIVVLFGGYTLVRVWSAVHAIAPQAQLQDVLGLVQPQNDVPGSVAYKVKHDERINLLLLGYGGPGHSGPYLTDSIMLLSIQPASREAIMISLSRDLWVMIPALPNNEDLAGKLNSAYAIGVDHADYPNVRTAWKADTGGGDLAAATVSRITGQPIDYWVGVDFKAFRDVVDALGGIRVDVPNTLDDPYFPLGETNGMTHIHFDPGWQQMHGEQALEYARSRETTSDFDRSRRQQLIMLGVRQRVFSLNAIPKMFSLLSALSDNVRTNLRPQDMRDLVGLAGQIKESDIRRVAVDTSNFLRSGFLGGQYVLQPLDPTYGTLQHFLAAALPRRNLLRPPVAFQVEDGSRSYWVPYGDGTPAAITASLLQAIGLHPTTGPAASQRVAENEILDGSGGKETELVNWLQGYFGAVVQPVPTPASGPPVTLVLGSNFTSKAFPYH